MPLSPFVISIPNVLNAQCHEAEQLYSRVLDAPEAPCYAFDLRRVSFLVPYGVMVLLNCAKLLFERTDIPVELMNLQDNVHSYLERIDMFQLNSSPLFCQKQPDNPWLRSGSNITVLEMSQLRDEDYLDIISKRAKEIFVANMGKDIATLVVLVLNELCSNVLLHSGDHSGMVLIQSCHAFDDPKVTCVRVAVSDMGYGMRASLRKKYPDLDEPGRAIVAAFDGRTSRDEGERGGLGIRVVAALAAEQGGHVWMRSETAALYHTAGSPQILPSLGYVPGTQVAAEFRV